MNNQYHNTGVNLETRTDAPDAAAEQAVGVIVAGPAARAAVGPAIGPSIGPVEDQKIGEGAADAIDLNLELDYWRQNFTTRAYVESGSSFEDYQPAYRIGVNARGRYPGRDFDEVDSDLSSEWTASCGASRLSWEQAKPAARDAWNRTSLAR